MDFAPTLLMTEFDGISRVAHGVYVDVAKSSHVSWKGSSFLSKSAADFSQRQIFQ